MYGCNTGIGIRDIHLTAEQLVNARHSIVMFQCFYLTSLIFVKGSICFALLRIATHKGIRQFLYFIIFLSFCCGFVTMMACLTLCVPLSASWTGIGKCAKPIVIKNVAGQFVQSLSCWPRAKTDILKCIPQYLRWSRTFHARFFRSSFCGTYRWTGSSSSLLLLF
jgi:hypothetical protein